MHNKVQKKYKYTVYIMNLIHAALQADLFTPATTHSHPSFCLIPQGSAFSMFCLFFNLGMMLIFSAVLIYTDWSMFATCSFLLASKASC